MSQFDSKALIAEAVGTLSLTLAVLVSLNNPDFPIPTPFVAALTLGLFVYTVGKYSGCHINPGVTLALWSTGDIKPVTAITYWMAQVAGAGLAFLVAKAMLAEVAFAPVTDSLEVGVAEAVGTAFLTFGVLAVVRKAVEPAVSGLVIGGSLLLGICIAGAVSNGYLNPAVAIGNGATSLAYVVGPLVGGVIGAGLYRFGFTRT